MSAIPPPIPPGDRAVSAAIFCMCQLIYRRKFLFNNLKNKALLLQKAFFTANSLLANRFLR